MFRGVSRASHLFIGQTLMLRVFSSRWWTMDYVIWGVGGVGAAVAAGGCTIPPEFAPLPPIASAGAGGFPPAAPTSMCTVRNRSRLAAPRTPPRFGERQRYSVVCCSNARSAASSTTGLSPPAATASLLVIHRSGGSGASPCSIASPQICMS